MKNRFKLDYCTEVRCDCFEFAYNGIRGFYDKSKDVHELFYHKKTYKFYPAVELSTSFFTEDDIDLLIFLRDELDIEAFPFNKSNGEITYLFLNKNWLFDVAIKLLYILKSSRMFNIVGSTLYIDGVEFDYKSRCSFGTCEYGEYSYGIVEVDIYKCPQMFLSSTTNSGCKFGYFKSYLTMLPIKSGNYCVNVCYGRGHIDNYLDYITDTDKEVSAIQLNKVTNCRSSESAYVNINHIKSEVEAIERDSKLLILMRGAPGSGKSTLIKNSGLPNYSISLDELRKLLAAEEDSQLPTSVNKEAYALLYSILQTRVQKGKLIILDAVNVSIDHIKDSIELVERYGYKIVYFQMQTSLEQCLENNLCRPAYSRASEEKIRKFHEMIKTTKLPYERIYSL